MKKEVKISTEYIKLDQLLKFSGVADTGSAAKELIYEGIVFVNGEVCILRGKKIRSGDTVSIAFDDETVEITVI